MHLCFRLAVSPSSCGSLLVAAPAAAQIDARMLRHPDVSATQIAFVYAGDIWVVPKTGGLAVRLSSPRGEEPFPRFSPDGTTLAYSANYDGNTDVYVVPAQGGDPSRLTCHPMADRVLDWHPDGTRVLFASSRESGRQRYNQFYLVAATGGLPEKLPVPYGEFATFSPDGKQFAYLPQSQAFRTWKRYRGGWAPDVWLFDLTTLAVGERHRRRRERRVPDVARRHDLLPVRSRRQPARQHLGPRQDRRHPPDHAVRRLRRHVPRDRPPTSCSRPAAASICSTSRPRRRPKSPFRSSPIGPRSSRAPRRWPRSSRRRTRPPASAPSSRRAARSSRVPAEHGPVMNLTRTSARRAVAALVARRQDAGLLERSVRRVRADAAAG